MTRGKTQRGNDWLSTSKLPDGSFLYVIRTSREYRNLAGGRLIEIASALPSSESPDYPMVSKNLIWNKANQEALAHVAMELLLSSELLFNVEIETGDNFNLTFDVDSNNIIQVVFTYPESFISGDCFNIESDGTHIRYTVDCGVSWTNIVDLASLKGEQGEQGIQGEQGPAGMDGIDGTNGVDGQDGEDGIDGQDGQDGQDGTAYPTTTEIPPPEEGQDVNQYKCAIASNVSSWALDKVANIISVYQTQRLGGKSIDNALMTLVSLDTGWGPKAFVYLYQTMRDLEDFGISIVVTQLGDTGFHDQVRCTLYCVLKAQTSETITLDDTTIEEWLSAIEGLDSSYGEIRTLFPRYLRSVDFKWLRRRAEISVGQSNTECEELCVDCPDDDEEVECWVIDIDLTTDDYDLTRPDLIVNPDAGEWISGQGWVATDSNYQIYTDRVRWVQRQLNFGVTTHVTYAQIWYDYTRGSNTIDGNQEAGISWDGGGVSRTLPHTGNGTDKTLSVDMNNDISSIYFSTTPDYGNSAAVMSGYGALKRVLIYGSGVKPDIAEICP